MNFYPVYISNFPVLSSNVVVSVILGAINALILSLFGNAFMYWKIILEVEKVSPDSFISCWSLIILMITHSSCYHFFNSTMDRSDWKSSFIPPRWRKRTWRSLDKIFHPDISWARVLKTLYFLGPMEYSTQVSLVNSTNSECPREL